MDNDLISFDPEAIIRAVASGEPVDQAALPPLFTKTPLFTVPPDGMIELPSGDHVFAAHADRRDWCH
ncbi:MAG: hypothetical protein JSR49_11260 [Proteobacteria bacterium]|nr:hypothetical protein [Pseudomonadota bacterium]